MLQSLNDDVVYQRQILALKTRTLSLEQSLSLLNTKFESFNSISSKPSVTVSNTVTLFVCEFCDNSFNNKSLLNVHKENNHIDTHNTDIVEEEPEVYFCNKCDFNTQYEEILNEHVKSTHFRTRYFVSSFRNKNHQDRIQKDSRPPLNLKEHIKVTVSENTPPQGKTKVTVSENTRPQVKTMPHNNNSQGHDFKCDECYESFTHKDEKELHFQYFHATRDIQNN